MPLDGLQFKDWNVKRSLFYIFTFWTISCGTDEVKPKTLDLDKFTIQVPSTWSASRQQGYDSFVGQIETSEKEKVSFDLGRYSDQLKVDPSTHNIDFVTIDNKRAKVVKPKNFGRGTTGVFFDSLETTKTNKFQLSGTGLNNESQKRLLTSIESLKFKN
jgi:hypothetical protein